ncbi:AI-2E family transporter [uncultured Cetobacterium sp.]|uniref:AI-2E family transporter n=1 Tax=uncultured Cetobacterium sp. TaxID=527638 RepID=UPI0026026876|nr:AI-2E family transporter [uncultured Cetobacterium sp.]
MEKNYINLFLVGLFLVLIQTFFQANDAFFNIISGFFVSIKPFIYAVFIAVLVSPLVKLLENKTRIKRSVAIGVSLLVVFTVIIGLIFIIVPNIINSVGDLIDRFPNMLKSLSSNAEHIIEFLKKKNMLFFDPKQIENNIVNFIKVNLSSFRNFAVGVSLGVAKSLIGLVNFFIGVFISLYLMDSKEYFMRFVENIFLLFTTEEKAEYGVNFIRKVNEIFLKYILGRILTSTVVGLIVFVVMFVTGAPYALLSAVMIGIGNMIPYVGSIIAGVIATFLIILAAPTKVIYLFIAIAIGQAVDGFVIGPKIMEESVGMSSFWTIIAVMLCGNLFGPLGMFLGVPVFVVIKIIYVEMLNKRLKKIEQESKRSE